MSVAPEVHDGLKPSRYERLRRALGQGTELEPAIALVVAVSYVVIAYLDGGTEPQFRAGAAIAIWLAVILGLVMGLWPRAPIPRAALIAGMCLGGLAALAGLSMAWANDNEAAFIAAVRVLAYLGIFIAVVLASSAGGARPWLLGLVLGLGAVALIAVLARLQPGLFAASQTLLEEIPPARTRLSFPTAYWNALGACMALGMVLFVWLAADAPGRVARAAATALIPPAALTLALTSSRGAVVALALGVAVLLVVARPRAWLVLSAVVGGTGAVVLLAVTAAVGPAVLDGQLATPEAQRQGDLTLLLLALVIAGTALLRFLAEPLAPRVRVPRLGQRTAEVPRLSRRTAVIATLLAVAVLLAVGSLTGTTDTATSWVGDRVEGACELPEGSGRAVATHLASGSGSGRCQYWEVGLDAFVSAPLGGLGAGGFEGWWSEHHTFTRPASFSHSIFITWLADLGLPGLLLIAGFLAAAFIAGVRSRGGPGPSSARAAALGLLAAGTFSATIDWMWEMPALFVLVIVAAGLLTGPALQPAPESRRSLFGFGVAALVAGWVTTVAALLSFFGQDKISDSQDALNRNDLQGAIDAAYTATTLQPWAAEPYLLKAAALEAQGDFEEAQEAVDAAIDRAPADYRTWAVAARIEAKAGDVTGALRALERANSLNPSVRPLGAPASTAE